MAYTTSDDEESIERSSGDPDDGVEQAGGGFETGKNPVALPPDIEDDESDLDGEQGFLDDVFDAREERDAAAPPDAEKMK